MRYILNGFNYYYGKYQNPVTIDGKKKFMGEWNVHVLFPTGKGMWMSLEIFEKLAITKVNIRKIETVRW